MDLKSFLIMVIENNEISNYKMQKERARQIYFGNYKPAASVRMNFWEFLMELWTFWYIDRFNKSVVYFNPYWIEYLKSRIVKANNTRNKVSDDEKYVTETYCNICAERIINKYEHSDLIGHIIRLQYMKQKSAFAEYDQILVEFVNERTELRTNCLQMTTNVNFNLKMHIKNNTNSQLILMDVIKINPFVTEITINKINLPLIIYQRKSYVVSMYANFSNSSTFLFAVVLVMLDERTKMHKLILKEIPVQVHSEYSNLSVDEGYESMVIEDLSTNSTMENARKKFVRGMRIRKPHGGKYKEKLPLKKYEIPREIKLSIADVTEKYPSFIRRKPTDEFTQIQIAREFGLCTRLREDYYAYLLRTLLYLEENQMKVDVRDFDTRTSLRHLRGNFYHLDVPELAESRPSLLVGDSVYLSRPNENTVFEGVVHKVMETAVELGFNRKFTQKQMNGLQFHIQFSFNRRPLKVEHQALDFVTKHEISKYFFPTEDVLFRSKNREITYFNKRLNDEQKCAVKNILEVKEAPYLLFGPPGTGKTFTLVEAILQVWKEGNKILVCAPSNAAVDEIASRLLRHIPKSDMFRLIGSIHGSATFTSFDGMINIDKSGNVYMPNVKDLLKYQVMLTTIVTSARLINGGLPACHYSYVFIDESGFTTETETLIPVAGVLSDAARKGRIFGQLVLAGDPKQLSPRIHSNFVKYCGFGVSMLERLMDTCDLYARDMETREKGYDTRYVTKLVQNYRSHPQILMVPNTLFYDDDLVAKGNEHSNVFTKWHYLKTEDFPLVFHNVYGEDRRDKNSPSFYNIQEVEVVMEYLSKLIGSEVNSLEIEEEHIGIIAPYRKQVQKLQEACRRKNWNKILVGSVEQFQGKEKLIIIISTVRSKSNKNLEDFDKKFELGFLRNPKRFNVAVTRSKALLILIGNANVLKHDRNWLRLVKHCVTKGSVEGEIVNLSRSEFECNSEDLYRVNVNDTDEGFDSIDFSRGLL